MYCRMTLNGREPVTWRPVTIMLPFGSLSDLKCFKKEGKVVWVERDVPSARVVPWCELIGVRSEFSPS